MKALRWRPWLAVAAACCAACTASAGRAETLLRWKFSEGQKLLVSIDQSTVLETTAGATPRKMSIDMQMELAWTVDAVDAQGMADITQSITRLKARLETAGAPAVEFDTAAEKQPTGTAEYFAAARKLVGVKLRMKLSPRGEIQDVAVADESKALLDAALAGTALAPLFSSAGLADTLKQTAAVLPEQALREGGTWQTTSAAKLALGDVRQRTTYTYRGPREVEGRMLEAIDVSSQLELAPPKPGAEHPVKLTEQKHEGTLLFDAAAGRFVESKVTQTLVTESPYRGTQVRVRATTGLTTHYRSGD
jgi:hypothetical protein